MTILSLPWLEASILLLLAGAACVSQMRRPLLAYYWGQAFTGAAFLCALAAWLAYQLSGPLADSGAGGLQGLLFGKRIFVMDGRNAPILPAVALLHFLVALATGRTKMRRFSFSWSLAAGAVRLALLSCTDTRTLIGLLVADAVPPCVELVNQGRSPRVYLAHMGLFVGLLVAGWALLPASAMPPAASDLAAALLLAALLVRCGTVPAHCWMIDWFDHASFGIALLAQAPLAGVYAVVRLVLPMAPAWMLRDFAIASLVTALYAAGMATVQRDLRRFFAYMVLSQVSLVLIGLELLSETSMAGALSLWFSLVLSLGGFGLAVRALESRLGRLSLKEHRGLYDHSPTLAVCFLLMGLAIVGFPGTLGFISNELLVDGTIGAGLFFGLIVIAAVALNGIAVLRAYFLLFTGAVHVSTVSLDVRARERAALLTLSALVLGGGLLPQPGVSVWAKAAEEIQRDRSMGFTRNAHRGKPTRSGSGPSHVRPVKRGGPVQRDWKPQPLLARRAGPNKTGSHGDLERHFMANSSMDLVYRFDPRSPEAKPVPSDGATARRALEEGNAKFVDWASGCQGRPRPEGAPSSIVLPCNSLEVGLVQRPDGAPIQAPFAVAIGCSDARVPLEIVLGQGPGNLFVVRVAGNLLDVAGLGSLEFAVAELSSSVHAIVVVGHSGCGAVTGAVDAYLNPAGFWSKSVPPALRGLLEKIVVSARQSAIAIEAAWAPEERRSARYRGALIETAVHVNAARTALELHQKLNAEKRRGIEVLYGVYNLLNQRVGIPYLSGGSAPTEGPGLADAPTHPREIEALAQRLAEKLRPSTAPAPSPRGPSA